MKELTKEVQGKYSYIVEADIKGFFNNIDHNWLMEMLKLRIKDKAFLGLIKKWLKAGVLEPNGEVIHPITGSPQGSIVSPVLANIYLHCVLDLWFEKVVKPRSEGEAYICRYADDFICAFRYKGDAKTSFEFLGFEFRWRVSNKGKDIIVRSISRSKLRKSILAFKEWCKENRNCRIAKIIDMLNAKLRGYFNYYGVIGNSKSLYQFYSVIRKILYKWLNRRSQRKSFNWREFNKKMQWYGLLKPRITEKDDKQMTLKECFA